MSAPAKFTIPFLLAISLVALLSCQQDRPTQPVASGPFVVRQTWPMDSTRMPDSVSWVYKGTFGTFSLTRVSKDSFRVTDSFAQSIASDTLTMNLWRLGLRTTSAVTVVQANGALQIVPGKREVDSLAVEFLLAFDSLRTLDRANYGSSSDPVRSQILSLQKATAVLVLAGKKSIDSLARGLDSLAVVRQILVQGAQSGSNIAAVAKATGLDTASLNKLAQSLLQSGDLKAADSTTLFPPYPVRVKTALSVSSPVIAGGSAVAVQGVFAWTKGVRISSPRYAVHTSKGTDTSFQFLLKPFSSANDTTWNLSGNFSLQAPASALPGTDTLIVTLSDDSGRIATTWATFQVVAKDTTTPTKPDTTRPVISFVAPAKDLSVANEVQNMDVEVTASDTSGIDSVKINNVKITAAPYKVSVPLAIGVNVVKALAWDKAGNRSDTISVTLTRAKSPGDTVPPKIVRSAPIENDTTVGHLVTTATLSYLVTDDSLASVSLDGKALTSSSSLYQTKVDLAVGPNTFVLLALDKHGNPARDTVKITRRSDTTKPVSSWQGGSKDTSVWAFVPSVAATWKVIDNALKLVTINGATANKSGDLYSQTVDLATDATWIRLMALDSSGNTTLDSVKVTRKYDKTSPTVVFQKTKYRLVANTVTTDTLVWTVTDDLKLKSVKIKDSSFAVSGGTYTLTVNLAVGTHRYALVATDSAGNQTFDTATVARTVLAPTHTLTPNGKYIGTAYDTLRSAGADSIEYSLNGTTWTKGSIVSSTGTGSRMIYARAQPGGAISSIAIQLTQIISISSAGNGMSGTNYALFLLSDGTLLGAGANSMGGMGTIAGNDSYYNIPPHLVASGVKWVTTTSGTGQNTYIQKTDGRLLGSGLLFPGQTGEASSSVSAVPFRAIPVENVCSVASNTLSVLFLKCDGTVWTGGESMLGGLHVDSTPVKIGNLAHIAAVAYSDYGLAAALDSSGNVWTWGSGIPGINSTDFVDTADTAIHVESGAKGISIGSGHMLILKLDGSVKAIGANNLGQLGIGASGGSMTSFTTVSGISNIISVKAGNGYSLFLSSDGTLFVSGMINTGLNTSTGMWEGPVYVRPTEIATNVQAAFPGHEQFMFLEKDGTLWGAGQYLHGEEPNGSPAPTPRQVNF